MDNSPNKEKRKTILRVGIFILIGLGIFAIAQKILTPSWNDRSRYFEKASASLKSFYNQEENVDQALFLGTSHSEFGASPMEIYEDAGIVSYNLSTSVQPIEVSYYLLRSAFESQSPDVVFLDVSNLYFDDSFEEKGWHYVIDGMPFGKTKIAMARKYATLFNEKESFDLSCEKDFINALFPIFQYHTRWSELSEVDFDDIWSDFFYATAGYCLHSHRVPSITVEEMNEIAASLEEADAPYEISYVGEKNESGDAEESLYSVEITDRKLTYLSLIKELCESKGATLVLVKYPVIWDPVSYASAWTEERSAMTERLADEMGLEYLDFLYDIDTGFDSRMDFCDGGMHCNYSGAKKISLYLSDYLQNRFGLEAEEDAQFEENREIYDKVTALAEIQISRECDELLEYIAENQDKYIICISAQEDMISGLGEEEREAFRALGLEAVEENDLSYADSYLAIIDQGKVIKEEASNRRLEYETSLEDCGEKAIDISMVSSGRYTDPESQILINDTEYSLNSRGMNLVLIDAQTQVVVMSRTIDTGQTEGGHYVNVGEDKSCLQDYWEGLLK